MVFKLLLKHMRMPHRGVNVPLVVVSLPMLIGFMAVAIFTGITAYVSDATHNVVQNAALAGASAMGTDPSGSQQTAVFTNFGGGNPLDQAMNICNQVAAREIAANPMLSAIGFNVGCSEGFISQGNAINDSNSMRAFGSVTVPGGVLTMIGMPTLDFEAVGAAVHHRQILVGAGTYAPNNMRWPAFNCPPHEPELASMEITGLSTPITDRPGNDLEVVPTVMRGYSIEGCAGGTCYDIARAGNPQTCAGGAACFFGGGTPVGVDESTGETLEESFDLRERNNFLQIMGRLNIPDKGDRAISYGSIVVDLGGTGGRQGLAYGGGVRHISHFLVTDDGVPISFDEGAEAYWHMVCAENTTAMIDTITSPHHAVAGFVGPTPAGHEDSSMIIVGTPPAPYGDGISSGTGAGNQSTVLRPVGPEL